jgi:hypothetical protein
MWLLFFKKLSFIILLKVKVASELLTANINIMKIKCQLKQHLQNWLW